MTSFKHFFKNFQVFSPYNLKLGYAARKRSQKYQFIEKRASKFNSISAATSLKSKAATAYLRHNTTIRISLGGKKAIGT